MYIKRDLEENLRKWKDSSDLVFVLSGARQVGKTTLLEHFGSNNFRNFILISFTEDSGRRFLDVLFKTRASSKLESFYSDLFANYAKATGQEFANCEDTLIVIDEIQESREVFEMIRAFHKYLRCRVIVTGSYLCKTLGYFQPVGDVLEETLYPISFMEFIACYGGREFLEKQKVQSFDTSRDEWYKTAYETYLSVGGYPAAVLAYANGGDVLQSKKNVLNTVFSELSASLTNAIDVVLLQSLLGAVVTFLVREKRGNKIIKDLTGSILMQNESLHASRDDVKNCIAWLSACGLISFCDKYDFNSRLIHTAERIYFNDLGILNYYLNILSVDDSTSRGVLAENFVFKTLNEPCTYHEFKQISPMFGILNNGELDFTVVSARDDLRYGIEVKAGKGQGVTANSALTSGCIDKLIFLKGNTGAGNTDKSVTLPLYAAPIFPYYTAGSKVKEIKRMTLFE